MSNNKWLEHVKAYQAKHGCTYKEAMTLSKASYKRINSKRVRKVGGISDIINSVKGKVASVLTRRPSAVTNLLKSYGDKLITQVDVCRQPIYQGLIIFQVKSHELLKRKDTITSIT